MVKLLMSWNIRPGRENEYFDFVVHEFGPGLVELGVKLTDAWYTQYSADDWPQILAGGVAADLEGLQQALKTEEWQMLKAKLLHYVTDYQQKIIQASGGFQL
jgi:hypothetical protein